MADSADPDLAKSQKIYQPGDVLPPAESFQLHNVMGMSFYASQMTTGRRLPAVKQMECVGGTPMQTGNKRKKKEWVSTSAFCER